MNDNSKNPIVGFPKEWSAFFNRHPSWHQVLKNLHQVLEKTFIRTASLPKPDEKVVFFMGRLCAEDFNEICFTCMQRIRIWFFKNTPRLL